MPYRGSKAVLKMADTDNETNAVTLTAPGLGCTGPEITTTRPARVVPGGSVDMERETMEREDTTGSFTIDANATTAPLFAGTSGERKRFWWYPQGDATGKEKESFWAFLTVAVNMPANDAITFTVTLTGDSAVTRAVA